LSTFAELEEAWRIPLKRATQALEQEGLRLLQQASSAIADLLHTAIAAKVEKRVSQAESDQATTEKLKEKLTEKLQKQIRTAERRSQQEVQRIYHHQPSAVSSAQLELINADIFTELSWQLFGLSRFQLVSTGAASGAVAGGGLDLLLGVVRCCWVQC
jgi:hypothetical protein